MYWSIVGVDLVDFCLGSSLVSLRITDLGTRNEECLGSRMFSFERDSKDKAMH